LSDSFDLRQATGALNREAIALPPAMIFPSGFIKPCQPTSTTRPPSGSDWVHEIKHDGYRPMVRRDGDRVHCLTRRGNNWADRFPSVVDAALRIKATSFLMDGEAVIISADGTHDFRALRGP
jgi:bifunctional non-homologous end joining protein LigD